MKTTDHDKLKFIDSIRVIHPRFKKAMDAIEEIHQESLYSDAPSSLLIHGDTGSGKTTLLKTYIDKHMHVSSDVVEGIRYSTQNILHLSLPSPVKYTILTERLLQELKDPYPNKGTVAQKGDRLVKLIRKNRVELIMLDEFQHFVDRDRRKVMLGVTDWFKSLMVQTQIPVIFFGLSEATEVLDLNPQLNRRVIREEIRPFSLETEEDRTEFQRLMFELDKKITTVFETTSNLADEECCERFMYATNGAMHSIMLLLRQAAKNALSRAADCIELVDLARAYERISHINDGKELNPFAMRDVHLLRKQAE